MTTLEAVMLTPENIVVYLSSTLRLHSSSYTPYFRNLPSKNNTQLFFSLVYRLRLAQSCEQITVNYVVDRRSTWEQKKSIAIAMLFFLRGSDKIATHAICAIKYLSSVKIHNHKIYMISRNRQLNPAVNNRAFFRQFKIICLAYRIDLSTTIRFCI